MSKEVMTSLPVKTYQSLLQAPKKKSSLARTALHLIWNARNPSDSYIQSPPAPTEKVLYKTRDGWESFLLRHPPKRGNGIPVLISTGPILHPVHLQLGNKHLLQALHQHGYDVYESKIV